MALLDLLGRRWTLRVLWELRAGPATFRELRTRCDEVSPTVLNTRLQELREARLVVHDEASASGGSGGSGGDGGYALTMTGEALLRLFEPLDRFAKSWALLVS